MSWRIVVSSVVMGTAVLLGSCSGGDLTLGRTHWQDTYMQSASVSVDVLFVVDNSSSMSQELPLVIEAFDTFITNLQQGDSGAPTDFHIGVTTMDMQSAGDGRQGALMKYSQAPGYRYISSSMDPALYSVVFADMINHLGNGVGWEKGLWAAKTALYPDPDQVVVTGTGPDGVNGDFLREDAKLAIIWVTDEDDCSDEGDPLEGEGQEVCYSNYNDLRPVFEYVSEYLALKQRDSDVVLSAIVGPQGNDIAEQCNKDTTPGLRYINAVDAAGGVVGSICESRFTDLLSNMGLAAAGIKTHFELSKHPEPESLEVFINEVSIPADQGWSYDEETNAVDFIGEAIPPRDSTVAITYIVASL